MRFWSFVREYLLFRWLFGSHDHGGHNDCSIIDSGIDAPDGMDSDIGYGGRYDGDFSPYDNDDYGYPQSYDDFLDVQDDYDMMDDDP